jgi:hypothetical protein
MTTKSKKNKKDQKIKQKVERLIFSSYLAMIKNSVGSKAFRNYFAKVNGIKKDVMKNGENSCAFFVSSILLTFELIKHFHATVNGVERDLKESNWKEIKKPKVGSIIIWEPKIDKNNEIHKHIGFYIGNGKVISNSPQKRTPIVHDLNYNGKRKIEKIYWNSKLHEK